MSVFYLKHKKHGTKVATEEAEVEHDKKRGWEEYEIDAPEVKTEVKSTLSVPKKPDAQAAA